MYNRISQSDPQPDGPYDNSLDIESADSRLDRGRSRHREGTPRFEKMAGRKLSQINVLEQTYDDPPPPSVIRSYRESKSRMTQPLPSLYSQVSRPRDSLHFPLPLSPTSPTSPSAATNFPVISRSESPQMLPTTPDSFLSRAFLPHTDASHSAEALSGAGGATSTQSHRSQIRLASEPIPVTNDVPSHAPAVIQPPLHRERADFEGHGFSTVEVIDLSDSQHASSRSKSRRHDATARHSSGSRSHRRSRGRRESEPLPLLAHETIPMPMAMPKPPRVRRDQIVLPAPLAPIAGPSRPRPYATSPQEMSPPHQSLPDRSVPVLSPVEPRSLSPRSDHPPTPSDPRVRALRRHGATKVNRSRYTDSFVTNQGHLSPSRRLSAPGDTSTAMPLLGERPAASLVPYDHGTS